MWPGQPGPPRRPIKRLLIANRGEIATRIIQCARELSLETYALTTANDTSHALGAAHILPLSSPSDYLNISILVALVKQHGIDAVHPGYGFLSESPEFSRRMWDDAGVMVVGPGWEILEKTGDKLAAKQLARSCDVPTLPATTEPLDSAEEISSSATRIGLPVMLKAVDGGGGQGIRLVRRASELEGAARRALAESPSRRVFVERAAVDGFRHVEVQVVGDGAGAVRHLWERECSIQRRHQKVVELAPSTIRRRDRGGGGGGLVAGIVDAALRMARRVGFLSLGTFEFLANPATAEFYFLEVNPRLQVEHTVTESITSVDIVRAQLEIAQGASLEDTAWGTLTSDPANAPPLHSVQLRLTAENVQSGWSLSIGRIKSFSLPTGSGIRVDTHLNHGSQTVVSADFDSLLAKIIVTAGSWPAVVSRCKRALEDTYVEGVTTNLDVLRAIVAHPDFENGACDTSWLERNHDALLESGSRLSSSIMAQRQALSAHEESHRSSLSPQPVGSGSGSTVLLRKGDAWAVKVRSPPDSDIEQTHHLRLSRVLRNEFPSLLRAEIEYSHPGARQPTAMVLEAASTSATSGAVMAAGKHRRGNPNDPKQIVIPFSGKLVEFLVEEDDVIEPGHVVCVVQQMKMELEVRASRGGRVKWITEAHDGEDVAEGTLAAELEDVSLEEVPSKPRL
ncbi:PycA protein [Xylariaceae sp. FL0804]|nr:PycA protein [Xylariaceae sp. FL0804]